MIFLGVRPRNLVFFLKKKRILLKGLCNSGGRNTTGRITAFHRGGGSKRRHRLVDFHRRVNSCGYVLRIEVDPNRSAKICLLFYLNGLLSYILAPEALKVGTRIFSGDDQRYALSLYSYKSDAVLRDVFNKSLFSVGNSMPLSWIPVGTLLYNIELLPQKGGQLCRAAGTSAVLLKKFGDLVLLKMRSNWHLVLLGKCMATIGVASQCRSARVCTAKAGFKRNRGFRPVVRGVAMNPVDHPHGGGEGKASGGKRPLSPWGKITKNRKTVPPYKRALKLKVRFR